MEVAGKRVDIDKESAVGESSLCVSCEVENVKTPACGACRECNEKMCTTCFRYHLRVKLCRNHVFLSLDEFSSLTLCIGLEDVTRCEKHDNELIKFYCRSHDIVGCGDCIVLGHTSCKPEYINDLAKSFKDGDTYKSIAKRLADLEKQKTDCAHEIDKGKYECESMNDKALKGLRDFRTEINKCLDEAEAKLLSEMKKLRKENTETQAKIEAVLQSFTSELQKMKQMLDTQLYRDNAFFINSVNCKSKLADIETMYEHSTKDMALKGFKFVRNDQMSSLLKSEQPIGSMQFCQIECRTKETAEQKVFVGARVRCNNVQDAKMQQQQANAARPESPPKGWKPASTKYTPLKEKKLKIPQSDYKPPQSEWTPTQFEYNPLSDDYKSPKSIAAATAVNAATQAYITAKAVFKSWQDKQDAKMQQQQAKAVRPKSWKQAGTQYTPLERKNLNVPQSDYKPPQSEWTPTKFEYNPRSDNYNSQTSIADATTVSAADQHI